MSSGVLPVSTPGLLQKPAAPRSKQQLRVSRNSARQLARELAQRLKSSQAAEPSGQEPFYAANEHQRRSNDAAGPAGNLERLGADHLLQLLRARQSSPGECPGEVFLVGTGPGDPGLLTLKAVQLLQTADVVLYDRLVSTDILQLIHNGARMVYVGKQSSFHTRTQDEIHELLCQFAQEHLTVVRLKGGDPYVFGRGGEELQYLEERGVQVHCVPGITAASGICADLGIPVTHRGMATSVRFLTGHAREGGEAELGTDISHMPDEHTTLVVYMGLSTLPSLTRQLIEGGLDPSTPAVAVERGTTKKQRAVHGPLAELQHNVVEHGLRSPTLIVIGQVVGVSRGWRQYETGKGSLQSGCRSANALLPKQAPPAFADVLSS